MNLPLIDAAEYFLNLKQAAGEALPAVEEAPAEDGLLQALSEAAKSKLGLAIAYRVYSESLRDPSNSAIGEHFKEHSEDCLNDVDFFVRRSSVMSGGASLEGVESPPASGDLTEILQVLSAMEEANLSLMSELVVLLEGNPSKYEVEAMMAKDQHHLDDLTQHMPVAPELPSVEEEEVPSVEETAPSAAPPVVIGPAKLGAKKGLERVKEVFTGSRAKKLWSGAEREMGKKMQRVDAGKDADITRAVRLGLGAVKERAKQVGAIGGTAAAATGAAVGAHKLLSKKDDNKKDSGKIASMQVILQNAAAKRHHGKEKTSEMGAAAMGQHSPVAPPGVIGPAKVAGVSAKSGLSRVGELLSGSRVKKLEGLSDKLQSGKPLGDRAVVVDVRRLTRAQKGVEAERNSVRTARAITAVGATGAGAAGAAGARKLLGKKDDGKEKTSEMGAAAMGQHSPVAPPAPLNGAAAGQHPKLGSLVDVAAKGTKALRRVDQLVTGTHAKQLGRDAEHAGAFYKAVKGSNVGSSTKAEALREALSAHRANAGERLKVLGTRAAVVGGVGAGIGAGEHAMRSGGTPEPPSGDKLAQRTYDMGGSKRDGKAYSMHTTPDDYELSQLISSKMDGDLRGVRGKAKNEGMLVGSGLGAVKGLKAGKGWGGGEVIRTGGGGGTVIGTFGSGGKMPKGMGADIRENQGMIRDELRGQGIKIGGLAQAAQAGAGRLAGAAPHIGSALRWAAHGAAPTALAAGAAGAVGGAVAGGEGHRLSGALKGGVGAGIVGGAAGGLAGAGAHRFATRALSAAAPKLAADKIGYRWDNESDESVARYADHGSDGLRYGAPIAGGVTGALMGRTPAGRVVGAVAGAGLGHLVGVSENSKLRNMARAEEIQRHQHRLARAGQSAGGKKEAADKSDSELAETGRQRAVANLASGFTSDKHTSGERHGTLAGRLGGAAVGAGAGALASKGATLPVRLAAGMGGAVIGGSMGGQIGKTIGSDHDAEKFWANHKEAGAGSSAAKWLAAHPAAVGGVAGSAIGAAGGAVAGGPEHRLSGALGGAAVGGVAGAAAGHVGGRLLRAAPSPSAAPAQLASGKSGTVMAGPLPSAHTAAPQNVSIGSSPTVIPSRAHSIGSSPTVIPSSPSSSKMRNLTMEGGEEMAAQYRQMPEDLRNVVESTPLVRDHKMQPHNALALLQQRGSWGPNWKGGTPSRVPNPAHESESAVARVLRQAAETKVGAEMAHLNYFKEKGTIVSGSSEMSPVLGKRVLRNAKQVWDKAVKQAMGEEAPVEQYLQEEAAGRQAQEAAESDYLREQLQQTSQQLEQTQAQAQEQEAQVGEMQGTIEQLQGQQAEQAQAADAAVQTARQTAEAAMSQSMQRSAELMKQTQLAAGLQNAAATMKEQLMALSQTPVPPATVGEAGELDAAAQQQVGQDQAMEEQAAMEEEAQMAAAQGAPPAAAPAAPAPPKTAGMISGAGRVLRNAPGGVVGAVVGAASAAGAGALLRNKETAFLTDAVKKLEAKQQGGFLTGMMLAEARMVADRSAVMDQHPGKAALLNAVRGAGAGFALDKTIRHIS